jgi:pyroglutamyl-peptidase
VAVVVFGFEPFLDFDENPAQLVVEALDGRTIGNEPVKGVVLPVDYDRIETRIMDVLTSTVPKLAIGFGLAQGREKVTPEKIAVNLRHASEPDNTGKKVSGAPIDPSQPDGIFSSLPVEGLAASLCSQGIPASVSFSAGAYLCNNAMFVIVREAKRHGFGGGFVHVPCHSEWVSRKQRQAPSLPIATIVKAAEHSVGYCLGRTL